jgi:hypothetical protein
MVLETITKESSKYRFSGDPPHFTEHHEWSVLEAYKELPQYNKLDNLTIVGTWFGIILSDR